MSLYKYVIVDRIDILRNELIRFTQPSAFNDPFECRPFIQSIIGGLDLSDFSIPINLLPDKQQEILAEVMERVEQLKRCIPKVRIPSGLEQELRTVITGISNELSERPVTELLEQEDAKVLFRNILPTSLSAQIGILSLAERPDNLLMWSHYAQNHTGFVIEFDEEHSFFKSASDGTEHKNPLTLQRVQYSVGRPKRPLINSIKDFEQNPSWYLVKSEEWQYEHEWRMMRPLAHADQCFQLQDSKSVRIRRRKYEDERRHMRLVEDALRPELGKYIYLFSLPADCIKSVILGCRMTPKNRRRILRFLSREKRYHHVKKHEATTDEKAFKLNITQLRV